ncbi:hypothetical protein ACWD4O_38705 [Streptomyces sp. NPDC002623]
MPSSLIALGAVLGVSGFYVAFFALVGRWRRRCRIPASGRPTVYAQLAVEARERQVRKERLTWAVDQVLAAELDRVADFYDPTDLGGPPVDAWGEGLLKDTARTHSLYHP